MKDRRIEGVNIGGIDSSCLSKRRESAICSLRVIKLTGTVFIQEAGMYKCFSGDGGYSLLFGSGGFYTEYSLTNRGSKRFSKKI